MAYKQVLCRSRLLVLSIVSIIQSEFALRSTSVIMQQGRWRVVNEMCAFGVTVTSDSLRLMLVGVF